MLNLHDKDYIDNLVKDSVDSGKYDNIKEKNTTCTICNGTGWKGIYHPVTLELTCVKCDCNKNI